MFHFFWCASAVWPSKVVPCMENSVSDLKVSELKAEGFRTVYAALHKHLHLSGMAYSKRALIPAAADAPVLA